MQEKQNFLKGAMVLSIAGAISKIMGAIYRIPLARLIGGEGMGLYQMAYPIYTTILSLATAGVPVAISVLVSRKETQGYSGDSRKIFRVSLIILLLFGFLLTLLVMQSASFLANSVLKEPRAYYPILAVAPAIFFAGLMSVFRGYFQGQQSMIPTAVSQVIEQLFRVTAVLILAFLLFPRGLEYAAAGATFGAVVGGIIGLIVLLIYYYSFRKAQRRSGKMLAYSGTGSVELGKEMVRLAIPVSFGAVVLPLVQMLDAIIVPGRLMATGYATSQATALYGELAGMAAVLISLPTIFTISIATSLVPAVSEALARNERKLLNDRLNYGFRAGMIISLPCAAGLYVLAFPICDLLYATPSAGVPLEPLAFSCIVLAAFQLSSAGLQGIGKPQIAMRNLLITGVFKVIFNYSLTGIPMLNIKGAAIGTVLAFLIGSSLNIIYLRKLTGISYEKGRMLKISLVTVLMAIAVQFSYTTLVAADIRSQLATLIAISLGVLLYGILLFLIRELDINMLKRISGRS
ncbi:MAG: polysaccharide biosynthesis protein [Syntrophomonas sp.]|uniref:putative polysaccharide biosynthesis protein n=1 Tax=Syntrophomonas sp. TaxID=2053627 RepID=UPI002637E496|nr:polysaccharide biosynthesis protein [Syntrophomonas sp.]MDD3880269.1 polysaccharide biosynthesis protein [Syntrophomonas sp.]MDD4627289.1 polysaccharide biosynthesis protein [Syntrophomonas sp.]